ncbi:hypothetical protein ABIE26_002522 [Pedobacter africanus]|uniref:Uncharacterized protein n=1 Tax=Pedobacter africanus TaxID=151894 RepID=A0ACC6KXK7_9SPHI|nr:hypothetical protein [Pedobacter africanus]MDR6784089.1 hypothetical protein [Pedobacter africanus]
MKTNSYSWLHVSVFVLKNNWHLAIKGVIQPFIKYHFEKGDFLTYKLTFDHGSAENISLSLLVPDKKEGVVAQSLDQSLKSFFKEEGFSAILNSKQNNTLFMPPLTNSVQYKLCPAFVNPEIKHLQILEQTFSNLMIDVFAEELVDDEMILTFSLYILFDCYKLVCATDHSSGDKWQMYYQHQASYLKTIEFSDQPLQEEIVSMEAAVNEIYLDISNTVMLNDLNWISKWEDVFGKIWEEEYNRNREILFFSEINLIITQQLNLNIGYQLLLSTFVNNTISKHRVSAK